MATEAKQVDIRKKIERKIGGSLPTLPAVVTKILEIALDETTSAQDAARVVETDQALSTKLLKLVNSPFYGLRHEVSTVRHAIALIGFQTLKSLVLSVSIFEDAFDNKEGSGLEKTIYWQHSLATAAVARAIAKQVGYPSPEEAYIAGLLHDMGKIIMDQHMRAEMREISERAKGDATSIIDIEESVAGCNHAAVGGWVSARWNLPPVLRFAIEEHHNNRIEDTAPAEHRWLAYIINMADFITWTQGLGSLDSHVLRLLSMRVEEGSGAKGRLELDKILADMDKELEQTAKLFHFDVPDVKRFRSALQKANVQLGKLNSIYHETKSQLESRVTELTTLNNAIQAARKTLNVDHIIETLVEAVFGGLGFDRAIYFEVDHDARLLRTKKVLDNTNLETNLDNHVFPLREDGSLISKCVFEQIAMLVDNPENARRDPILSALDIQDVVIAPVKSENKVVGVLCGNSEITHGGINQERLNSLNLLAEEAGMAIENALLYQKTKELAVTDSLTQIANRQRANEFITTEFDRAGRYKRPLSMVMFDIDFFKKFNDTYGHEAGDIILKQVAQILKLTCRTVDLVARYGGEEFLSVLPETPINGAIIFGERVRRVVEKLGEKLKATYPECVLTISSGAAAFDPDDPRDNAQAVLSRADQALYRAKSQGRNQVCAADKKPVD